MSTVRMLSEGHRRILLANHLALKHGLSIVREILADKASPLHSPLGMTTDELYKLALQHTPSPEFYNPHTKAGVPFPPVPTPRKKGKKREPPPPPPNPEHPVRSKIFLKNIILQYLVGTQEIVKSRVEKVLDSSTISTTNKKGKKVPVRDTDAGQVKHIAWVWKSTDVVDGAKIKRPRVSPPPIAEPFGAEVGVGEDISHLNARRQKARKAEVRRETRLMKVLNSGAELRKVQGMVNKSQQESNWEEKRLAARKR